MRVDNALERLRAAGIPIPHTTATIDPMLVHRAREALGLRGRRRNQSQAVRLTHWKLTIQLLRPLREKCKVGPMRTTPIENVWGRGVPDHQKDAARQLVEEFLAAAALGEKQSQGRRHVWITQRGLALLQAAEEQAKNA